MFLCILSFLKSKYLYSSLKSSLTEDISIFSEFTSKGSTLLHFPSIVIFVACSSISPVGILLFLLLLSETTPSTDITHSVTRFSASSCKLLSSPIIICVIPNWSLKSINFIAPKFLILCTQPASLTVCPTFAILNSPQLWVLYSFINMPPI